MLKKIKNNVWRLDFKLFGSYVYFIKFRAHNILIDTGSILNRNELTEDLKKLNIKPSEIDIVLLTHNHPDHSGGIKIFKNAKIYGDKQDFQNEKILDLNKLKIKEIKIIKTPGHTKGSVCFLYKDILFSGDTLFNRGTIGRIDLPTSTPEKMQKSLKKLLKINYKILCPGHGYE